MNRINNIQNFKNLLLSIFVVFLLTWSVSAWVDDGSSSAAKDSLIQELLELNSDNWDNAFKATKKNSLEQFQSFLTQELSVTIIDVPTSKQAQAQRLLVDTVQKVSAQFEPIVDEFVAQQLELFENNLKQAYQSDYSVSELEELVKIKKNPVLIKDTHTTVKIYDQSNQSMAEIGQLVQDERLSSLGEAEIADYFEQLQMLSRP